MHAGEGLWNIYALLARLKVREPVLGELGFESCKAIGDLIKVPLPTDEELSKIVKYHQGLVGVAQSLQPSQTPKASVNGVGRAALELCDRILAEIPNLPEAAEEFAVSVEAKVRSMRASIEQRGSATPKMEAALQNMYGGVQKWSKQRGDEDSAY